MAADSAETSLIQPKQHNSDSATRAEPKRLTAIDLTAIAKLVAEHKLTESEACYQLGINPQRWFVWKCKNKRQERFASIIDSIRGNEIANAMQKIKDCGNGVGMRQPDWRAHAWRLGMIAPERFNDKQQDNSPKVINLIGDDAMKRIEAMFQPKQLEPIKAQVIDAESKA